MRESRTCEERVPFLRPNCVPLELKLDLRRLALDQVEIVLELDGVFDCENNRAAGLCEANFVERECRSDGPGDVVARKSRGAVPNGRTNVSVDLEVGENLN